MHCRLIRFALLHYESTKTQNNVGCLHTQHCVCTMFLTLVALPEQCCCGVATGLLEEGRSVSCHSLVESACELPLALFCRSAFGKNFSSFTFNFYSDYGDGACCLPEAAHCLLCLLSPRSVFFQVRKELWHGWKFFILIISHSFLWDNKCMHSRN